MSDLTEGEVIQMMKDVGQVMDQLTVSGKMLATMLRESQAAYQEVTAVAIRMAERLGHEDPDTLALAALLTFQAAEMTERNAEWDTMRKTWGDV